MSERPINLRAWEVRAWLDGRLSQIRRPVKPQPNRYWLDERERAEMVCPFGAPGDVLWGREAWRLCAEADATPPRGTDAAYRVWYEADAPHQPGAGKLRPSVHMPRWACRIRWRIKSVRVERVQDMINADATASGVHSDPGDWPICTPRHLYSVLWERHYGPGSWDANPWVWVLEIEGA